MNNTDQKSINTEQLTRRVYTVIALAVLLLISLFVMEFRDEQITSAARTTVQRSLSVERSLNNLAITSIQIGALHNRYLLRGSATDAEAREAAFRQSEGILTQLRTIITSGPAVAALDSIDQAMEALAVSAGESSLAKQNGNDSLALALLDENAVTQARRSFQTSIRLIMDSEAADLDANRRAVKQRLAVARTTRTFGRVLLASVIGFLFYSLRLLTKRQESLISDLQRENDTRLQTEKELTVNLDKLRVKNEELDHFAYIASHDLQEPLRTVTNFLTVLKEDFGEKIGPAGDEYFQFINGATTRMKRLITNLLHYSQLGRNEQPETVDLDVTLNEVLKDLRAIIREKSAVISTQGMPTLNGYPTELRQLMQNLVLNALKFTRPGVPPVIEVLCDEDENHYRITVRDNGIGISAANQKKIFRMFARVNEPGKYEGQGIGLAFCRKIAELHGGQLTVDSTEGAGSTFIFTVSKQLSFEKQTSPDSTGR